jgi:hypothetical protein
VSAHTPGPWRGDGHGYVWARTNAGEMLIAQIRGWGHLIGIGGLNLPDEDAVEIQDANRALIAAAPDLLRALKDIDAAHSGLPKSCGHEYECVCTMDAARHAIAKAEGRTL